MRELAARFKIHRVTVSLHLRRQGTRRAPAKSRFVQFVPRTRWPRSQVAGSSRVASRERARRPTRTFRYFAGALRVRGHHRT
jgi:hypothetical protein